MQRLNIGQFHASSTRLRCVELQSENLAQRHFIGRRHNSSAALLSSSSSSFNTRLRRVELLSENLAQRNFIGRRHCFSAQRNVIGRRYSSSAVKLSSPSFNTRLRRVELVSENLMHSSLYGGCHLDLTYLDTAPVHTLSASAVTAPPTVLLLHDVPGSSADSMLLTNALAQRGARVLALNFPGFGYGWGATAKDLQLFTHSTESKSELAVALLHRLGVFRPDLVLGHGMGCLPAQHLAYYHPDKFRGAVFMAHPGWQLPRHLGVFSHRLTDFVATLWGAGPFGRALVRAPLAAELLLRCVGQDAPGRELLRGAHGGVAGWGLPAAAAALSTAVHADVALSEEMAVGLCATGASYMLVAGGRDRRQAHAEVHLEMADALQVRFSGKTPPADVDQLEAAAAAGRPLRAAYWLAEADHLPQAEPATADFLAEEMLRFVRLLRLKEDVSGGGAGAAAS